MCNQELIARLNEENVPEKRTVEERDYPWYRSRSRQIGPGHFLNKIHQPDPENPSRRHPNCRTDKPRVKFRQPPFTKDTTYRALDLVPCISIVILLSFSVDLICHLHYNFRCYHF